MMKASALSSFLSLDASKRLAMTAK